jgi:hypothetical protein
MLYRFDEREGRQKSAFVVFDKYLSLRMAHKPVKRLG